MISTLMSWAGSFIQMMILDAFDIFIARSVLLPTHLYEETVGKSFSQTVIETNGRIAQHLIEVALIFCLLDVCSYIITIHV